MVTLNWRAKKQLSFFLVVFGVVAVIFAAAIYFLWPEPTCTDGRQNGAEEGIDCGGSCTPCVVNPKDIVILWSRAFKTSDGVYDVAALVENPNLFYGLPLFKYTFKVYDTDRVLIAIREGQTFLNPHDNFLVFASGIRTGSREAGSVTLEAEKNSSWKYLGEKKSSLVISEKTFFNNPFPVLSARITNQSLFPVKDIQAAAVLYDKNENAMAVSTTKLDFIGAESDAGAVFTWLNPFSVEPVSSKVFTRIDLTK